VTTPRACSGVSSHVAVRPVAGRADLDAFIQLAWSVQGADPCWVPPLRAAVRHLLETAHPFWKHAQRELFLAERDGRVIGRIAAIRDEDVIAQSGEQAGAFGFFECEDNADTARALFEAAAGWCRARGLGLLRGPFNPSTNYEIGMLVEGYGSPPCVMMTYNPPRYAALVEGCGLIKEKDVLAFRFRRGHELPQWAVDISRRVMDKGEVCVRHVDKKRLLSEVELMSELYRSAWARNWGFVPMSRAEIQAMAEALMPILDEELAFFLYVGDDPAAVCLVLPDVNPMLRRLDGKLGITGVFKYLLHKSEIRGLRCLLFGVKPQYQQMGVPLAALDYILKLAAKKRQYDVMEMGWTLEDNEAVNGLLLELGGEAYKRYRIYRMDF